MTDPEIDEEFWHIAIMSVLADIRQDVDSMLLRTESNDEN